MRLGAVLEEVFGDNVGRRHRLLPIPMVIGRSTGADIQLDQDSVSRRHAEVTARDSGWFIRDRRSLNGTFVNDAAITERELASGDLVKIGRTIFRFTPGLPPESSPSGSASGSDGGAGSSSPPSSTAPVAWRPRP
jgi:two-component system, cell cycle response regulator